MKKGLAQASHRWRRSLTAIDKPTPRSDPIACGILIIISAVAACTPIPKKKASAIQYPPIITIPPANQAIRVLVYVLPSDFPAKYPTIYPSAPFIIVVGIANAMYPRYTSASPEPIPPAIAPIRGPKINAVATTTASPKLKYPLVAGNGILMTTVATVVKAPITAIAAISLVLILKLPDTINPP